MAAYSNSPDRSTKSTTSHIDVLCVLVNTRFQVLFHSPPGVLFTFPSQYYSLSVTREYLGLEGGPPVFIRDFTCPALLRIQLCTFQFHLRGYHPLWPAFPCSSIIFQCHVCCPKPRLYYYLRFSLLRFRSPLLTKSRLMSFPRPT